MSAIAASGRDVLIIGGRPTVDLLPPEVKAERRSRAMHRWLIFAVVALAIVVALGVGAAFARNITAQLSYAVAQQHTLELTKSESKYADVFAVKSLIATGQEAQHVVGAPEVDWQGTQAAVVANLPAGTTVKSVAVEQGTPMTEYIQAPVALQAARIATVTLTLSNPGFVPAADFLDGAARVPGYVDAQVTNVEQKGEGDGYETTLIVHLGDAALTNRFVPKEVK